MKDLLTNISNCTTCLEFLPLGINPVLAASKKSKIVIIGQAPGSVVHKSGIPWQDKSGDNLRNWLGVTNEQFYNPNLFALIPMGFCYPGKGKTGDLPPRKECAPKWHSLLFEEMKEVQLIILIGTYAQKEYLKSKKYKNLTETVKNYHEYLPKEFVLPHPSPRNNIWQAKNKWFKIDVIPALKVMVKSILEQ